MTPVDDGLWCEFAPEDFSGRPAMFLDRDGVIIEDLGYIGRADDVRILPGAAEAIAHCNRLKIPVVVVTNQSGIARGYYDWNGFHAVQAAVATALSAAGAHLDAVLACAHHAGGRAPYAVADHPWRKPNGGMIIAAAERMHLDLSRSWIVGDKCSDIEAGRAAQLAGGVLVSPSGGEQERGRLEASRVGGFQVEIAKTLFDAVERLIARGVLLT